VYHFYFMEGGLAKKWPRLRGAIVVSQKKGLPFLTFPVGATVSTFLTRAILFCTVGAIGLFRLRLAAGICYATGQ